LHVPRELSGRAMTNAFTGESMKVQDNGDLLCSEVLAGFPVALLID
jgi:maltooligosyltrehalose synthase